MAIGMITNAKGLELYEGEFQDEQTGRSIPYYQLRVFVPNQQKISEAFPKIKVKKELIGYAKSFVGKESDIPINMVPGGDFSLAPPSQK